MQARSRLKPHSLETSSPAPAPTQSRLDSFLSQSVSHQNRHQPRRQLLTLPHPQIELNPAYMARLPNLIVACFFYGLVIFILREVPPREIQNWLLPDVYLPFQMALLLANWSLLGFLLLNTRRSFLAAAFIQSLFFLKFQQIELNWQVGLSLAAFFVIIERLGTFLGNREPSPPKGHANFKKPFHHRRRTPTRSVVYRTG